MKPMEIYRHDLPPFTVLEVMSNAELNALIDFHSAMRTLADDLGWDASSDFYTDNVETLIAILSGGK